jgi:hypothetical protein
MSEWITDRLPTAQDSDILGKVWITENGFVHWADFTTVENNQPWMAIKEPEPYEPQRWTPNYMDRYWYVTVDHKVATGVWMDAPSDYNRYEGCNCFQTEEQAEEAARRMRELLINYHKELMQ